MGNVISNDWDKVFWKTEHRNTIWPDEETLRELKNEEDLYYASKQMSGTIGGEKLKVRSEMVPRWGK